MSVTFVSICYLSSVIAYSTQNTATVVSETEIFDFLQDIIPEKTNFGKVLAQQPFVKK